MKIELDGDASIEPYEVDERGRITIGREYANQRVRAAILERIIDPESEFPTELPQFNFSSVDLDPERAPFEEKQRALLRTQTPGSAYWVGFAGSGEQSAIGIDPDVYRQNLLITGEDRETRDAALQSQFQQIATRGCGAIVYAPEAGSETDENPYREIVRECGREGDIIEVNLSDSDSERFNYLETPSEYEPESAQFAEAVEQVVDDVKALVAQDNRTDGYWGPRMERIVRNMGRAMGKSDRSLTLQDLYLALIGEQGRRKYGASINEDRIEWIDEYAARQLADVDESDTEPLISRLQQWIEHDSVRRSIAATKPTFSLRDAFRERKIVLISKEDTGTGLAQAAVAIAATMGTYRSMQGERKGQGKRDDPHYLVAAGFDRLENTNKWITAFLSLSRSESMSTVASVRSVNDFAHQEASTGQFFNHLTFTVSEATASALVERHSKNITQADLRNLAENHAYLRTEGADSRQFLESVKVRSLIPVLGE